jgi:hypothetical protein
MPSARDLMQKADALMRSNRNLGGSPRSGMSSILGNTVADHDVPVLTDIVIAGDVTVLRHDQPPAIAAVAMAAPLSALDESRRLTGEVAQLAAQRETEKQELAESVYFEVLRDLDVDTIDGMRERISSQLMPVFESMGRELVVRVEQALSDAIRDQVAAAIERRLGGSPQSPSQGPA